MMAGPVTKIAHCIADSHVLLVQTMALLPNTGAAGAEADQLRAEFRDFVPDILGCLEILEGEETT
jgi:hypothetical protein